MRSRMLLVPLALFLLCARETAGAQTKVKLGSYDSRSIAVAWAASPFNDVGAKVEELKAAKAAGDEQKVQELEAWGAQHQQVLHLQGFSRVPVSDLLLPVKSQLEQLARELGLAAVVMSCDYRSDTVEIVDITERVVEFYQPSEQTRKSALGIRQHEPLPLIQVLNLQH